MATVLLGGSVAVAQGQRPSIPRCEGPRFVTGEGRVQDWIIGRGEFSNGFYEEYRCVPDRVQVTRTLKNKEWSHYRVVTAIVGDEDHWCNQHDIQC